PAPTPTYSLSLHDALPISLRADPRVEVAPRQALALAAPPAEIEEMEDVEGEGKPGPVEVDLDELAGIQRLVRLGADPERTPRGRSEEHTSELQSRSDLVCR